MTRVIVPALLAIAMVASSSANASAFGLFDKLCKKNCCDSCAACEPACGCEAPCEPACGCEAPCEPACGCEVVDPCCDSGCCKPRMGLLQRLFKKHRSCCDTGCEPACGCEAACEPACGCEAPCEPACGCEVVDPCCDSGCCAPRKSCLSGLFGKLFKKRSCCDTGCEPACGCEAPCEPACGCEPTCGCEPSCGCGH